MIELPEQSVRAPDALADKRRVADCHAHGGIGGVVPGLMIVPVIGKGLVLENLTGCCAEVLLFDH